MSDRRRSHAWRAGVIAAGRGERLQEGRRRRLKPLVSVGGRTLVERVLESLAEAAPSEVVIIVNEASVAVKDHVAARRWPFTVRWLVETTPSSMHSFLRVMEALASDGSGGPFLVSTVDTIAPRGAFASFARAAALLEADVTLAVAPPADDEKPLLVQVGREKSVRRRSGARRTPLEVTAIGTKAAGAPWSTAGYYAVRPSILREAAAARSDKLTALRTFLERLLARGYRVAAVPVAAGVDVDRPADVDAAEALLRQADA